MGLPQFTHTGMCEGYHDWSTSEYILPFPSGVHHTVTQGNCGPASHFGPQKYAYDFNLKVGDPIVAIRGGVVLETESRFSDNNGCPNANFIRIRHEDGSVAAYYHLTQNGVLVSANDQVAQGQLIGRGGNTGCSSSPHLHLIVFANEEETSSVPITFRNTSPNPRGLITGVGYTAD